MVTSSKSVARKATAVAAAALAASPLAFAATAARADGSQNIFLYRSRDTAVHANCTGTHEIELIGTVNLGEYFVWDKSYIGSSTQGIFFYSSWESFAATRAIKQEWCYTGDVYYQYYAANQYHRKGSNVYVCNSGCQYFDTFYGPWYSGA
jgi:hypothetical protein